MCALANRRLWVIVNNVGKYKLGTFYHQDAAAAFYNLAQAKK